MSELLLQESEVLTDFNEILKSSFMPPKKVRFAPTLQAESPNVTKIVHVYYNACCGCGCVDVPFYYKVPADSHIQDGDILNLTEIDSTMAADSREALEGL